MLDAWGVDRSDLQVSKKLDQRTKGKIELGTGAALIGGSALLTHRGVSAGRVAAAAEQKAAGRGGRQIAHLASTRRSTVGSTLRDVHEAPKRAAAAVPLRERPGFVRPPAAAPAAPAPAAPPGKITVRRARKGDIASPTGITLPNPRARKL